MRTATKIAYANQRMKHAIVSQLDTLRGYADSCLPAHERNEWERDLDSFNQGVE
jgi:hypothetical protein